MIESGSFYTEYFPIVEVDSTYYAPPGLSPSVSIILIPGATSVEEPDVGVGSRPK